MGIFTFIKNAGKSLFGKKDKAPTPSQSEAPQLSEEQMKLNALQDEIKFMGIPVNGLSLSMGDAITIGGVTPTGADREKLILTVGNVEGVTAVTDNLIVTNPEPEAVFYTVVSGDSLSKISKAQYGDPMKYNQIFEANKPMLSHPDKIYPGQVLRIPQN